MFRALGVEWCECFRWTGGRTGARVLAASAEYLYLGGSRHCTCVEPVGFCLVEGLLWVVPCLPFSPKG